jgi:Fur family ferric uptake transcriptional regulator
MPAAATKKTPRTLDERRSALRTAGLRSTAPRLAVLRELERAEGPVSHGEIAERLEAEGFDRATVYRNLMDLTVAKLAVRTDHGDHVWRFELFDKDTPHEHPHFVCTECGSVSCLPETSIKISARAGSPRALSRKAVEVQVKGACDACD